MIDEKGLSQEKKKIISILIQHILMSYTADIQITMKKLREVHESASNYLISVQKTLREYFNLSITGFTKNGELVHDLTGNSLVCLHVHVYKIYDLSQADLGDETEYFVDYKGILLNILILLIPNGRIHMDEYTHLLQKYGITSDEQRILTILIRKRYLKLNNRVIQADTRSFCEYPPNLLQKFVMSLLMLQIPLDMDNLYSHITTPSPKSTILSSSQ